MVTLDYTMRARKHGSKGVKNRMKIDCKKKGDNYPFKPVHGDMVIEMETGKVLVYNGRWGNPASSVDDSGLHSDFRRGGKLRDSNIKKYFPPEKKESFLNYVKLFHNEILSELLVHYSKNILEQPWPEAEEHINDYWMEEYNTMKSGLRMEKHD